MANKKKLLSRMLVVSLIILCICLPEIAFAQKTDFSELEKIIVEELKEKHLQGVAIAIVSGDKIVFAKGFGTANVETNVPVTPDMLFQIGSLTKTFTATALLTLAEEGKLRLDVPVGNYAKGLSPKLSQVTLHRLLSHTAGLKDETAKYGLQDETALEDYVRSWRDDYCFLNAGQVFSYSNSGFALAGFIMQEVGGKPYADLMTGRLFQPLGMTSTTFRPTVAMTYPLSVGHRTEQDEKVVVVRPMDNDSRLWPAGTMYSSANELARFAIAFLNGGKLEGKQVLSPSVIAQMSTQQAELPHSTEKTYYGYGLFISQHRGTQTIWHDGFMSGFSCILVMSPKHHFAIVMLLTLSI